MKKIGLFLFFSFACNGGEPPPPPPPETCDVWSAPEGCECPPESPFEPTLSVCAPPRVDRPVDWGAVRGVTAFSLALRNVHSIADFTHYVHEHGWTTLRVGAQTSHDWCQPRAVNLAASGEVPDDILFQLAVSGYLPCGPPHGSAEWRNNLVRLLEVTARIKNTWVQLIPTFTYKSHDEGSQEGNIRFFNAMFDRVDNIVKEGGYKHVFYELFNEVEHPLSQHIKDEDVRAMFLYAQSRTSLPLGTDFHGIGDGNKWRGRYPFQWRDVSRYLAFHTPRNPEPSLANMREVQEHFNYQKPVLIDETVAWASDEAIAAYGLKGKGTIARNGYGTEDSRMIQVIEHLRNIHKVGWKPFYHSIWGIQCLRVGRIPDYDEDVKK